MRACDLCCSGWRVHSTNSGSKSLMIAFQDFPVHSFWQSTANAIFFYDVIEKYSNGNNA